MSTRGKRRPRSGTRRRAGAAGRSRRKRVTGSRAAGISGSSSNVVLLCIVGLIAAGLVWSAVQAVYVWLAEHWYVSVLLVVLVVAAAYVAITMKVAGWRERRERLARLRFTAEQLDAMTPTAFELACRDLMRRDGLRAEQVGGSNDQGADVKGYDQGGRVVVVQCKHTVRGANVGAPVLYGMNGTARQVHGAHLVVVATNGGFTQPARAWAPKHEIHLLDRAKLLQWARDGHTLHAVLGVSARPGAALRR